MEDYVLLRSRRKTLALRVLEDGRLEVRAPLALSRRRIEAFLEEKAGWIARQRERMAGLAAARRAFCPGVGGAAPYLGKEYPVCAGEKPRFDGAAFYLVPGREAIPQLVSIYRGLAKEEISRRVELLAQRLSLRPAGVKITSARTRYGSCSGKNSLCFAWRLVLAPPEVVDYVVAHELCHIREHNHSARFWAEVERVLPDYREREKSLRSFGRMLAGQDWDK